MLLSARWCDRWTPPVCFIPPCSQGDPWIPTPPIPRRRDPWILGFDEFLKPWEADHLIQKGGEALHPLCATSHRHHTFLTPLRSLCTVAFSRHCAAYRLIHRLQATAASAACRPHLPGGTSLLLTTTDYY